MLIRTKFIGPTNTKGPRVKATSGSGISIVVPWAYGGIDENHNSAADALKIKLLTDGREEPAQWIRRWDLDGTCIHVGIYKHELKD